MLCLHMIYCKARQVVRDLYMNGRSMLQVEGETVKARYPLAATSRPGLVDLDASSAPGGSRLGQPRRSAYAEEPEGDAGPEEHSAESAAQHAPADLDYSRREPDSNSVPPITQQGVTLGCL